MVLKTRQPKRRKFQSTIRQTARRKREYFYSSITVLLVKIILLVFLIILLKTTIGVFIYRFSDSPAALRYSLPGLIVIMIAVLIYYIIKNINNLKEEYKNLH